MAKNTVQQNRKYILKKTSEFQEKKNKVYKKHNAWKDSKHSNDDQKSHQNQRNRDNFFLKPSKNNCNLNLKTNKNLELKESKFKKKPIPDTGKSQGVVKPDQGPLKDYVKPSFDKKLYRLKKYSNKFKVQMWEERRKKVALRNLKRNVKHSEGEKKLDVQKIYEEHRGELNSEHEEENETASEGTSIGNQNISNQRSLADKYERDEERKNKKGFKRAQAKFEEVKNQKQVQLEEFLRKKQEKEEALRVYKQKKTEKFKKLSMKTKKGQPVMKGRMELLLEQIQNSIKNE